MPSASATQSEPMPISSPWSLKRPAPLWSRLAGAVKIAPSMWYSQFPENGRRDTSRAMLTAPVCPPLTTTIGLCSVKPAASPSGTGSSFMGTSACTSPKPVARS